MTELAQYCGAWREDGPVKCYTCRNIDQLELDTIHERTRTHGIAAGLKPGSPELDTFIEMTLFAALPVIDAQRDARAKPGLHVVKE